MVSLGCRLILLYFSSQHLYFLVHHHILLCIRVVVYLKSKCLDVRLQLSNTILSLFEGVFELKYFHLGCAVLQSEIPLFLLICHSALLQLVVIL